MTLRLDRLGWPVVRLASGRYIHLYPLSVYHLERYAWEQAAFTPEVAAALGDRARVPAADARVADAPSLLATGLSWRTGEAVAAWLGGRLPGRGEHLAASELWQWRAIVDLPTGLPGDDDRVRMLARALLAGDARRDRVLPSGYGDMVSEFAEPPFGDHWVVRPTRELTRIAPLGGLDVPVDGAGLSLVFEERDVMPIHTGTVARGRGAR